jgi:putative peptidoglycan lipid II flippase
VIDPMAGASEERPADGDQTPARETGPRPARSRGGAIAVAAGIFLSRIFGFVRERALSHYLGNTDASGAFRAALRIPNLLQNLLGEGVLSASFIPVYAKLVAQGREEEASRVARAVATLLALLATLVAALGVTFAPAIIDVLAPGFDGDVRDLTVTLVRILFPGTALLVLSAWCLGVLNSHRRFFLSYASPVLWNSALIAAAIAFGSEVAGGRAGEFALAEKLAWGAVVGSALQLVVQIPTVWLLLRSLRPSLAVGSPGVKQTVRAFGPVLLGRGSVQLSAYVDQLLASYLGASMVSAMAYAQTLYLLPVALFGMSVSAAELPEMSSATGSDAEVADHLKRRLEGGLRKIVFLVVPSAIAFLTIGRVLVGALYETGQFGGDDTFVVWIVLAGSALGLTAGTQGRLFSSAFYALGDTRTPLRWALVRVTLSFVLGWAAVLPLRAHLGYAPMWGAFGLTATAGLAAWVEFEGLRRALARRIGGVPVPVRLLVETNVMAIVAGAAGFGVDVLVGQRLVPWARALVVVPVFGAVYLALAMARRIPEAERVVARLRRRRG